MVQCLSVSQSVFSGSIEERSHSFGHKMFWLIFCAISDLTKPIIKGSINIPNTADQVDHGMLIKKLNYLNNSKILWCHINSNLVILIYWRRGDKGKGEWLGMEGLSIEGKGKEWRG